MSNSTSYFKTVQKWRAGLRSINAQYDERREKLDRFKGSSGYDSDMKDLETERVEAISALRVEVNSDFQSAIAAMRENTSASKPYTAPSQEQLAILPALKMHPHVSVEMLNRAAVSVSDNGLCLAVLDGIAREAGHTGVRYNTEPSTKEITDSIDQLEKDARGMLRLNRTDCRRDNAAPGGDISLYRLDVDPDDLCDCLSRFGGVKDAEAFCSAVD